jgi:hypothetical protein
VENSCPLFVKLVLSTDRIYMQLYTFVKTYEMDMLPEFGAVITKQAMKALGEQQEGKGRNGPGHKAAAW